MIGEWTQKDVLERFAALTKIARLMRRRVNHAGPAELMWLGEAVQAKERAIGYTTECIAQELHKFEPQIFSPELQVRFKAVGDIIDRHVKSGPIGVNKRRALIERAEAYIPSSAGVLRAHEPEDDETIARALNVKASMVSYIFDREIGRHQYHAVDRPLDGHDARRLTDSLGNLHRKVDRRLAENDYIFSKPEHDRVLGSYPDEIKRELDEAYLVVRSRPSDLTLVRVDQQVQAGLQAAIMSDDSLFSSPESSPAASVTTSPRKIASRRRKHEEISSSDEMPQIGLAARHRRRSEPGQSSTSSIVLTPPGQAVDAQEDLVVDGQAANLRQSDRSLLQGPDEGIGWIAPRGRRSESSNQRSPREHQRNRGGGLEY
ncbi:hypothetical protein [Bradyrhizobium algeriense]|uniref:hypothetical protein n=1 Tax=Bradyrhizobium algeriense TaxID=634784 RepID=UPI0011AEB1FE|nr:hypothetical protein [Bradyrhizobium algeriense]